MKALEYAIKEASKKLGIPEDRVGKIYKAYWRSIRQTIQELPLKDSLSQEEFLGLTTSFNIPSLGKLHTTYDEVQKIKGRFNYLQKIRNAQNKED